MIGTLLGFLNEKSKTERESEDVVFTKLAFTQCTSVQLQVSGFSFIVTVFRVTSTKMKGEFVRGISVAATSEEALHGFH
jgi:hypothetical protein